MAGRRSNHEGTVFYSQSQGSWVAEISLPSGKRKRKYGKTQKAVREWLLKQRDDVSKGLTVKDDRIR